MPLAFFIKDYIGALNGFYESIQGNINVLTVLKFSLFYLLESIKIIAKYFFSFKWIIDFSALKVTIPNLIYSTFVESSFFGKLSLTFSNILQYPYFYENKFILGLINSFFISIPFSLGHILWLRRLVVQGLVAGVYSGFGIILSQCVLMFFILFGFRPIIFSWFSFESVQSIIGIIISLSIICTAAINPLKRITIFDKDLLYRFFILHFVLVLTDQSGVFSYFGSLSINLSSSSIESLTGVNQFQFFETRVLYFLGTCFGVFLWTCFFGWVVAAGGPRLANVLNFSYSQWVRACNFFCLTFGIALSLTALPYYNLDYLLTSPAGFSSKDNAVYKYQLRTNLKDLKKGRMGEYSGHNSLDTDITAFDRSRYLTLSDLELTFEDLNYQGEYVWRSRNDRLASGSGGKVNRLMSKFFPKTKRAIEKLKAKHRLLAEKRRLAYRAANKPESESESESEEDETIQVPEQEVNSDSQLYEKEDLLKRFFDDYHTDDPFLPDPYLDQESFSAFSELVKYGFDTFASLDDIASDEFEERLGKRIKSKYYSNFVYKYLLNFELATFLGRQPKEHCLTIEDENTLFERRLMLGSYYNTVRDYSKIPYSNEFKNLFLGAKSYANRVYNQQFKGTLKIIRRLFVVSLDKYENPKQRPVLKFDQPLYKRNFQTKKIYFHNEVNDFRFGTESKSTPFLEETEIFPFYIGWDERLRKFIMANYGLTNSKSGLKVTTKDFIRFRKKTNKKILQFLAWPSKQTVTKGLRPLSNPKIRFLFSSFDELATQHQHDIFEYPEDGDSEIHLVYDTLPSLLKRVDLIDKEKIRIFLHPLRGGFLWQGEKQLNFDFQNLVKEINVKRFLKEKIKIFF